MKKNKIKKLIPYLILFIFVLVFSLSSNISPIGNKISGVDSSVFRYVGTIMSEGKIPYVDVFDHKGIFLYIINYFGILLDKNTGVWIIELIFLYTTSIFAYKLSRLFTNKFNSILAVVLSFIPLIYTFEGGNLTEEYALPFITISLYLFTKEIKNHHTIKFKTAFLIGLCLGAVLLLRPNMIVVWICMSIYLLILYLKNKEYKYLFKIILYFILGIITFVLPFMIYLFLNNALKDFIYQYIIFNFQYSSKNSSNTLIDTYSFFIKQCKYIYLTLIVYFFAKKKYDKGLIYFYISTIIISFIIIIMPKNLYAHYGMIITPTFIVAFSVIIDFFYEKCLSFFKYNIPKKIMLTLIIFFFIFGDVYRLNQHISEVTKPDYNISSIINIIKSNTNSSDNILVYGNDVILYLQSERRTHQKYPYHLPIIKIDKKIEQEFKDSINNNNPKMIILNKIVDESFWNNFESIKSNYQQIYNISPKYNIYKQIFY